MPDKEFEKRITRAALKTWNELGADAFINDDGEFDDSVTLSKDEVIELVCDASRMQTLGGLSRVEMQKFYELPFPTQDQIMQKVFTADVYSY